MSDYRIGTAVPLTDADLCETRFGVDPRATYNPGAERLVTLEGLTVDVGYPRATWTYVALSVTHWSDLLTLVGGYSGEVYVETRDDVDAWAVYRALARLPEPGTLRRWGKKYLPVIIDLVLLEVIP